MELAISLEAAIWDVKLLGPSKPKKPTSAVLAAISGRTNYK